MLEKIKSVFSKLFLRFSTSSFVKSVMTLSAGVVVSQSISLFTTPIISRIYTPEIIGDISIITSYSSIIGDIISLGLLTSIMIPKDDDEAKGLCRLLTLLILTLSTIILAGVLLISNWWKLFDVSISYSLACLILWLHVTLVNISAVCYAYINRQRLYKVLFWNPTIGTVTNAIISIGLGLLHLGLWGYASGLLVSSFVVLIHMLRKVNPFKGQIRAEYSPLKLLRKHKDFPLYQYPANLISTFSNQMPVQLISRFFGSIVLGSYSMCMSILGIPSKFLSAPVNRVYFQEATSRYNNGNDIGDFSFKILISNIKLAIIPIAILIIFGKPLFEIVLGDKWSQAGSFTAILGVYQLVLFCSSCLSGRYVIIGKQKINLYVSIIRIILTILAFLVGYKIFDDVYSVLILYSFICSTYLLFDLGLFLYYAGIPVRRFLLFVLLYIAAPSVTAIVIKMLLVKFGVL